MLLYTACPDQNQFSHSPMIIRIVSKIFWRPPFPIRNDLFLSVCFHFSRRMMWNHFNFYFRFACSIWPYHFCRRQLRKDWSFLTFRDIPQRLTHTQSSLLENGWTDVKQHDARWVRSMFVTSEFCNTCNVCFIEGNYIDAVICVKSSAHFIKHTFRQAIKERGSF